jgi:hypothetical protein
MAYSSKLPRTELKTRHKTKPAAIRRRMAVRYALLVHDRVKMLLRERKIWLMLEFDDNS